MREREERADERRRIKVVPLPALASHRTPCGEPLRVLTFRGRDPRTARGSAFPAHARSLFRLGRESQQPCFIILDHKTCFPRGQICVAPVGSSPRLRPDKKNEGVARRKRTRARPLSLDAVNRAEIYSRARLCIHSQIGPIPLSSRATNRRVERGPQACCATAHKRPSLPSKKPPLTRAHRRRADAHMATKGRFPRMHIYGAFNCARHVYVRRCLAENRTADFW